MEVFARIYKDSASPWGTVRVALKGSKGVLSIVGGPGTTFAKANPGGLSVPLEAKEQTEGWDKAIVYKGDAKGGAFVVQEVADFTRAAVFLDGTGNVTLERVRNPIKMAATIAALIAGVGWLWRWLMD